MSLRPHDVHKRILIRYKNEKGCDISNRGHFDCHGKLELQSECSKEADAIVTNPTAKWRYDV